MAANVTVKYNRARVTLTVFNIFVLFGIMACSSQPKMSLIDPELSQFNNLYDFGNATTIDGEMHLTATKNWFFTTRKKYQDFVLEAEILMPDVKEYSNSGVLFRGQIEQLNGSVFAVGYQAEVDPSERRWSGGLFDQGRRKWLYPLHPKRSDRDQDFKQSYLSSWSLSQAQAYKPKQWNKLRIEAFGSDIKIFLNGTLTTHVEDHKDKSGVIGFQHHGSKQLLNTGKTNNIVKFRNIYITPSK